MARFWLVVGLLVAVPLAPQELSREEELDSLRLQIHRLQTHLARLGHERRSLQAEVSRLGIQLELQRHRVREAEAQVAIARGELERLETDVADLEADLEQARAGLRNVLVRLYRSGDESHLRLLLSLEEGDDLLVGLRQLRFLAQRDAVALRSYLEAYDRLSRRRDDARRQRGEIEAWLADERVRRDELEALEDRQSRLLATVEREHREVTVRTDRLIDRERKLAELIDLLAGNLEAPEGGESMRRFRGVLDWPVAGRVTKGFGPRLDPRYGTRVPHNGLELATTGGDSVRTVFGGRVLYAAPFEGYGLTAIVLHPGRVFSLYAGLRALEVAADDVLSLGDLVGVTDDSLYFEIRVENRPEDPAQWLR